MADSRLQTEFQDSGYRLTRALGGAANGMKPSLVYEAKHVKTCSPVVMRLYDLGSLGDAATVCKNLLRHSTLTHPHLVPLRSLLRTSRHLCVVTDAVLGGDIFTVTRRAGRAALPPPAARFLVQQLLLAAEFLQHFHLHVADVNPSDFLVNWNPRGMPILKVAAARLERDCVAPGAIAVTNMTCPHRVRAEAPHDQEAYACAADSWAICVTTFFLLYGRWPFSRPHIQAWASQAPHQFQDHLHVDFNDIVRLLGQVFQCGTLPAAEFSLQCPSVSQLLRHAAIEQDLPQGAREMTETFCKKTEARRTSRHFIELEGRIHASVKPPSPYQPPPARTPLHPQPPRQHHSPEFRSQHPVA